MCKKGCNFFSRNQTSLVNLQLLRNDKKVDQVVYGREYVLRADISQPDGESIMLQTQSAADLTPRELFLFILRTLHTELKLWQPFLNYQFHLQSSSPYVSKGIVSSAP